MFHALLLGSDRANAPHTAALLHHFDVVSGASRGDQGLALIARRPVDVVATPRILGDMSGFAFAQSVQRWHPNRRPRLLLMEDPASDVLPRRLDTFDAVVAPDCNSRQLCSAMRTLATSSIQAGPVADQLSGTFDGVDFASLIQVIASREKTGRLVLRTESSDGCLLYRNGSPIHAASRGLDGQPAFRILLHDVSKQAEASFYFEPLLPGAISGVKPTIEVPVERLLLDAA